MSTVTARSADGATPAWSVNTAPAPSTIASPENSESTGAAGGAPVSWFRIVSVTPAARPGT